MKALWRLKPYLLKYRKTLLAGLACVIAGNLLTAIQPRLVGRAVDILQTALQSGSTAGSILLEYSALIIGLTVLGGICSYLTRQTIIVVSRHIEFDLRNDFLARLQRLPAPFFITTPTGDIMAHATNDISSVRNVVGPCIMYPLDTLATFLFTITLMFLSDWQLTLLALVPLPFVSLLVFHLSRKIHHRFEARQAQFSALTTCAQENFSGIRIVQSYNREDYETGKFRRLSRDYLVRNLEVAKVQSLIWPLMFMLIGCSMIVTLIAGGLRVMDGRLTIGGLTAFFGYLTMLIWPMIAFGWVANMLQQGAASLGRLMRMMDTPPETSLPPDPGGPLPAVIEGRLEFQGTGFTYPGGKAPVLEAIDLTVEAGQTLAIVGYTGSGKSTLVNLIPRLLEPTNGRLLLDGIDIRKYPLDFLRSQIGYVRQESFLFSDSLSANIGYGLDSPDEAAIRRAAGVAQLDEDINGFPAGFDTLVGERGITLSGGQKQRMSIARAVARNPRILILDDALSAVDTGTESRILHRLREVMRQRTCLLISHRVSTVQDAGRIVVLHEGRITEAGTHQELLDRGGIYAELHAKQLLEEELEAM